MVRPIICAAGLAAIALGALALWVSSSRHLSGFPLAEARKPAAGSATLRPGPLEQGENPQAGQGCDQFLRRLEEAVEAAKAEPDQTRWDQQIQSFADSVEADAVPPTLDLLRARPQNDATRALILRLLRRWAGGDPTGAAAWASGLSGGLDRLDCLAGVATVWATQNLGNVVSWANQFTNSSERQTVLAQVGYEAAREQPFQAIALAEQLMPGASRDDLLWHAASRWAEKAPAQTADWAARIGDPTLRERVLGSVVSVWSQSEPAAAGTFALHSTLSGRAQEEVIVGIAERWVQNAPNEAAAWVTRLPESSLRQTCLRALVQLWPETNSAALASWLKSLPAGPSRDTATEAYVRRLTTVQPDLAARWAGAIDDPTRRQHELERIAEDWLASDAPAARTWISQAPLPEPVKSRLLSQSTR